MYVDLLRFVAALYLENRWRCFHETFLKCKVSLNNDRLLTFRCYGLENIIMKKTYMLLLFQIIRSQNRGLYRCYRNICARPMRLHKTVT